MFYGVPKSVVLASLLGLIPILMGLVSTFNIGLNAGLKKDFIEIQVSYLIQKPHFEICTESDIIQLSDHLLSKFVR